jgi:hypothetical protein
VLPLLKPFRISRRYCIHLFSNMALAQTFALSISAFLLRMDVCKFWTVAIGILYCFYWRMFVCFRVDEGSNLFITVVPKIVQSGWWLYWPSQIASKQLIIWFVGACVVTDPSLHNRTFWSRSSESFINIFLAVWPVVCFYALNITEN